MTTTAAGRFELAHPDLGTPGGASLWSAIHGLYTLLGNAMSVQYFGDDTTTHYFESVANNGYKDLTHNFGMAITQLDVRVVESGVILSQELQAKQYTITQQSTDMIRVQNISGGNKTFAVYIMGFNIDNLLGRQKAYLETTDGNAATLETITVPTDESVFISAMVSCRKNSTNANAYGIKALAENNGGTVAVRVISKLTDEDVAAYDVTIDASGATARIRVTGEVATTVEWNSVVQKTYF